MSNDNYMIIKARIVNHSYGEVSTRKVNVPKNIELSELDHKLRERFDISEDKEIDLYYTDEEDDRIIISFEDELVLAFNSSKANKIPTFDVVIKPKVVDGEAIYPHIPKELNHGDCAEILIESEFLTIENAMRDDTRAWGTYSYTVDSDLVKTLAHSGKINLPEDPPLFNVIVTIRIIPGNIKYVGSTFNGVTTLSYGPYDSSYVIENVRNIPLIYEKTHN